MRKGKGIFLFVIVLLLVGCNNGKDSFLTANKEDQYQEQRQEIERVLKDDQHVKRVTALLTNNEALIGIEVKPLSKWNKKKYELKWQKELEKALPEQEVVASTDLKIIIETDKLAKKKLEEKKLDKKIKELKKLKEEET